MYPYASVTTFLISFFFFFFKKNYPKKTNFLDRINRRLKKHFDHQARFFVFLLIIDKKKKKPFNQNVKLVCSCATRKTLDANKDWITNHQQGSRAWKRHLFENVKFNISDRTCDPIYLWQTPNSISRAVVQHYNISIAGTKTIESNAREIKSLFLFRCLDC